MLENQKILAISGKKGSGKNTACNFIHSLVLPFFRCTPHARIDPVTGYLIVLVEENEEGILDLNNRTLEFTQYMEHHVWPYIKKFSFAEPFKRAAVDLYGIPEEFVYGTDEQKNSLTKYKWEDMPIPAPRYLKGDKIGERVIGKVTLTLPIHLDKDGNPRTGFMTAREFLQYMGAQIGREMSPNIWVDTVERNIIKSMSGIAIIDDCRYPNEVAKVKSMGGQVIRLTRNPNKDNVDVHDSETALDPDVYDWNNFDRVIDNENMTIEEFTDDLYKTLIEFGWVENDQ